MSDVLKAIVCVEGVVERDAMQAQIDPTKERVLVVVPFQPLLGWRAEAIFCRWPSQNWFDRKAVTQEHFQDWVREHLALKMMRGGDFRYI
jgi:hypothetical protein